MKKPSKKEIKEKLEKFREAKQGAPGIDPHSGAKPQPKKPNKERIRKQGV
jgi:hypothetical protein